MGPTASGKADVAEGVANELDAVLLNADAFQIYRWMDIGTAKPTERSRYRLLDIRDPNEPFGLGEWIRLAIQELEEAWKASRSVIVVGGTGLYIRALFEGYEALHGPPSEELRSGLQQRLHSEGLQPLVQELVRRSPGAISSVDLKNPVRVTRALERLETPTASIPVELPPFVRRKFAISRDPEELKRRIERRTTVMLEAGWLDEVQHLLNSGFGPQDPAFRAHGYRGIAAHLGGEMEYDLLLERTVVEVRQYGKRQRTWLRREPSLTWLPDEDCEALAGVVLKGIKS